MPFMGYFLLFAFLFMLGCSFGWVLEVFYRRFISSSNPERRWINPGFLTGPALPLYGTGVCAMWLIVSLEPFIPIADVSLRRAVLFLGITLGMTLIEYIAGLLSTRVFKVQLWDYSRRWGNIQGIICPLFTLFWGILGIAYYYLVHPLLNRSLHWLMEDTNVVAAYAFCMGMYYGILLAGKAPAAQRRRKRQLTRCRQTSSRGLPVVQMIQARGAAYSAPVRRAADHIILRRFSWAYPCPRNSKSMPGCSFPSHPGCCA